MAFLFLGFCWPISLIAKEGEAMASERLIFGIIIPAAIFLISLMATLLIYRHFVRQGGLTSKKEKEGKKEA